LNSILESKLKEEASKSSDAFSLLENISSLVHLDSNTIIQITTSTLILGTFLFCSSFFLHQVLREDFRQYISGILNSNSFNLSIFKNYVHTENQETRTFISNILSDMELLTKNLYKEDLSKNDINVTTILDSLEKQSLLLNKILTSENVVISSQNSELLNMLQEIQISLKDINTKFDVLELKVTLIKDVVDVMCTVDGQIPVSDLTGIF